LPSPDALADDALPTDKKKITVSSSALEACEGAAAVIIATEWDEFKTMDWQAVFDKMSKPAFVVRSSHAPSLSRLSS
jgi:UDPglucose 6-dehydrogenase